MIELICAVGWMRVLYLLDWAWVVGCLPKERIRLFDNHKDKPVVDPTLIWEAMDQ